MAGACNALICRGPRLPLRLRKAARTAFSHPAQPALDGRQQALTVLVTRLARPDAPRPPQTPLQGLLDDPVDRPFVAGSSASSGSVPGALERRARSGAGAGRPVLTALLSAGLLAAGTVRGWRSPASGRLSPDCTWLSGLVNYSVPPCFCWGVVGGLPGLQAAQPAARPGELLSPAAPACCSPAPAVCSRSARWGAAARTSIPSSRWRSGRSARCTRTTWLGTSARSCWGRSWARPLSPVFGAVRHHGRGTAAGLPL